MNEPVPLGDCQSPPSKANRSTISASSSVIAVPPHVVFPPRLMMSSVPHAV
jgi:hypothetical protein